MRSHTYLPQTLFPSSVTHVTQPRFHLSAFSLSFSCFKTVIIKQNAIGGNRTNDTNWQIHGLTDAVTCLLLLSRAKTKLIAWSWKKRPTSVVSLWIQRLPHTKMTTRSQPPQESEEAQALTAATRQRNAMSHLLHTVQRAPHSSFLCRQDSFMLLKYSMHGREYFSSSGE